MGTKERKNKNNKKIILVVVKYMHIETIQISG